MIKKAKLTGVVLAIIGALSISTIAPTAFADNDASVPGKASPAPNHSKAFPKTKAHSKSKAAHPA